MKNVVLALIAIGVLAITLLAAGGLWVWRTMPPDVDPDAIPSQVTAPPDDRYHGAVESGRTITRTLMAEEKLPGLSVAVAVDGDVVWAEGFGRADRENPTPVTPATRFRIGAVSQTITAAAVGILRDRGRLDLDVPIRGYLPELPEKAWPITTRELMAHTAGLRPRGGEGGIFRGPGCADDAARLALVADVPLEIRPGTEHRYAAAGWILVGAVVAATAGEPYLDVVQREVLTPLGMTHTAPDAAGADDRAVPYYPRMMLDPALGLQDAPTVELSCYLAAVGFQSTPTDLVRLGIAMMDEELLRPETAKELLTPVRLESGALTGEALGWTVESALLGPDGAPTRIAGQGLGASVQRAPLSASTTGGQVAGGTATLLTLPGHGVAVAVTTNVSGAENVAAIARRLADLFIPGEGPG